MTINPAPTSTPSTPCWTGALLVAIDAIAARSQPSSSRGPDRAGMTIDPAADLEARGHLTYQLNAPA
jgi:hypothetical protein